MRVENNVIWACLLKQILKWNQNSKITSEQFIHSMPNLCSMQLNFNFMWSIMNELNCPDSCVHIAISSLMWLDLRSLWYPYSTGHWTELWWCMEKKVYIKYRGESVSGNSHDLRYICVKTQLSRHFISRTLTSISPWSPMVDCVMEYVPNCVQIFKLRTKPPNSPLNRFIAATWK